MVAGAFGLLGAGYLVLALNPRRHRAMLPWAGWLMVAEGCILAAHGLRLGLPALPFYADVAACLAGGVGILAFRRAASTT